MAATMDSTARAAAATVNRLVARMRRRECTLGVVEKEIFEQLGC
jgi:hypothetical protein